MQLQVFSIRDSKGEIYNQPFYAKTHGEAERNFTQLVRDAQSMPSKFPEDFDLYYLGSYDDQKGTFESLDTPRHVMKAVDVKSH